MFRSSRHKPELVVRLLALVVMLHGLLIIFEPLTDGIVLRGTIRRPHIVFHRGIVISVAPLLIGLTLIYLSIFLLRQKRTAWLVTAGVYGFYFLLAIVRLVLIPSHSRTTNTAYIREVILAGILLILLLLYRNAFQVKSSIRSFAVSLQVAIAVLGVTLVYGVVGFHFSQYRDFHQYISVTDAFHRTIDQFDLTTGKQLVPYTQRAKVFMASLSVISTSAVASVFISLFQPLRARFGNQHANRELAESLLRNHSANSEDFFKLWPHDKLYFFNGARTAGIAYAVRRGVALGVGDPMGDPGSFDSLLSDYDEMCRTNDWLPAFVHTEPKHSTFYKHHGYKLQKIGEEAILDLDHFEANVKRTKYFRQITNRFTKLGYHCDVLEPPHSQTVMSQLFSISNQWLTLPGRSERGFMMGYFTENYMQQCTVVAMRDSSGEIQGFLNQITSFDKQEANFDLLRHSKAAPGNSNDFILMAFIDHLRAQGMKRLNLGLCPLSGIDSDDENRSMITTTMQFIYANGDRFYSFSGLKRFKAKYEPQWQNRYIAHTGGIRGFTRILSALFRAMKV